MQVLQLASGTCQRACRLLGCCKVDGDACIVMSLYPKAAAKRLEEAQGPLPVGEVMAIGLEVLEGLEQLHEAHILHLDLKPANILLDKHGHAYLSDFGISHAIKTLETCTAVTGMSGTPHYMAPEQVDAEFGIRGTHTDVWGFAASILHLATGQLPYAELSQMQMVSAMSKRRRPDVPASLPAWLQQALRQSFSFDTGGRPMIDLQQLFKAQSKQGSMDSSRRHPLPAVNGAAAQSHQAADARRHLNRPSSIQGTPMSTVVSKTVATVRAARARLGRTPDQQGVDKMLVDAVVTDKFAKVEQALLQGCALDVAF